tara:strand:- start:4517 stop:4708 length:192 start_codon:yes stop_codon:yes gene_type:complete
LRTLFYKEKLSNHQFPLKKLVETEIIGFLESKIKTHWVNLRIIWAKKISLFEADSFTERDLKN